MNNEVKQQQLVNLYNILYGMQVQGDSAFKVVNCLTIIRSMIQQIESDKSNEDKNSEN